MQRFALYVLLILAAIPRVAHAQFHDPDPAAVRAFREMIEAYRKLQAITVKTTVEVQLLHGEMESNSSEVEAEFLLAPQGSGKRAGVVNLRGFNVVLNDGTLHVTHEGNERGYFTSGDDGSPYYALMFMLMDLPFPHLAIVFAEEDIEDLFMQFHPKAAWSRPTAVRTEDRDGRGGGVQIITMTSDFERMDITLDPRTKLIESIDLRVEGGQLVLPGYTLVYKHRYEHEVHEQVPADALKFEPGDRERADSVIALMPQRERPAPHMICGAAPEPPRLVGKPAPDFRLNDLDGNAINLADLRGRVVVLDFWATWCGPCIRALPLVHEVDLWAREEGLPVTIIAVNTFEDPNVEARPDRVREFWTRREFTLPVAMDLDDSVAREYGVSGIPATFIIRPDGIVHAQHLGAGNDLVERLRHEISEALEDDGPIAQ